MTDLLCSATSSLACDITIHNQIHSSLYICLVQENCTEFPPNDLELVEGSIPIPRVCWNGMLPGGIGKLLPLSLWLCIQYLGLCVCVHMLCVCVCK